MSDGYKNFDVEVRALFWGDVIFNIEARDEDEAKAIARQKFLDAEFGGDEVGQLDYSGNSGSISETAYENEVHDDD